MNLIGNLIPSDISNPRLGRWSRFPTPTDMEHVAELDTASDDFVTADHTID